MFVYDEAHLRARCREAVAAFGDGVAYAAKAFLCTAMAALAHEEGMHLDVATGGELHVALAAGVPADRLVLHGNNKSEAELARALEVGVGRIVVDSFDEVDRLERLAPSADRPPAGPGAGHPRRRGPHPRVRAHRPGRLQVRLRPPLGRRRPGRRAAGGARLGRPGRAARPHRQPGLRRRLASSRPSRRWPRSSTPRACPSCPSAAASAWPTSRARRAPTITEWAGAVQAACADAGITARVTAEPGRAIAAAAAITLYTVGTIKDLPGIRTYVAVDGGMSDNPRPVLYGSGYETFLPRATDAGRDKAVRVVGKHCESGDLLVAEGRVPADLAVGDVLATPVTGAYGHSMGSNYNKVPRPPVVFVKDGDARLVVRRETEDDLLRLDV